MAILIPLKLKYRTQKSKGYAARTRTGSAKKKVRANKGLGPHFVPVCVEILDSAEDLRDFIHPEYAAYVFGCEDGSVSQVFRRFCHRFVKIPSKHCLNLAAAMNVVLYDRLQKEVR